MGRVTYMLADTQTASECGGGDDRLRGGVGGRGEETSKERLDRNFEELTGELRVVITGVQVRFAFLLVIPFDTGFAHVGSLRADRLLRDSVAGQHVGLCMIAPAAQHRFLFRHDDKRHIVFTSNRIVIAGLVFLALAMWVPAAVRDDLFGVSRPDG